MVSAEECRTLRSCPRQVQFEEYRFWDVLVWVCGCHDQGIWGSGISRFVFRTRDEAGGLELGTWGFEALWIGVFGSVSMALG